MTEYRVSFDAAISFRNGGGLTAEGFRLDVSGPNPTEIEVGELLVRHLGLLMVESVELRGLEVFPEAHKGSRNGPSDPDRATAPEKRRIIELGHPEATGLDGPFQRFADGTDLAGLALSKVVDIAVVLIDLTGSRSRAITPEALAPYDLGGRAVLLHTGWDRHWGTERYRGGEAPYLDGRAARGLADAGAALVGIDGADIDDRAGASRPSHSILLDAGIPVLQHLTGLSGLPVTGARLHAVPPLIREVGTAPVRVYAVIGD